MTENWHWPSAQTQRLFKDFQAGRIGHAFLLTGPAGVGKRTLASLCAKTLHCQGEHRPCGSCGPCLRFDSGNHPDAFLLTAEKRYVVDEIRALTYALEQRAYEGGVKTVRLTSAELMNPQAQNALLKTLEEPPGPTVFFLTALQDTALLPTVRSRCLGFPVPPLSQELATQVLMRHDLSPEDARLYAQLSDGAIGKALALSRDPKTVELRRKTLACLDALTSPGNVLAAIQGLKEEKDQALAILDILEGQARLALRRGLLDGSKAAPSPHEQLLAHAPPQAHLALYAALARARRQLSQYLPWQTVLETCMLAWIEILTKP